MTNADKIARLIEAEKKATPGPWVMFEHNLVSKPALDLWEEAERIDSAEYVPHPAEDAIITTDGGVYGPKEDDAEFIAAAREGVPAMAARIARLEAALRQIAEYDYTIMTTGKAALFIKIARTALEDK